MFLGVTDSDVLLENRHFSLSMSSGYTGVRIPYDIEARQSDITVGNATFKVCTKRAGFVGTTYATFRVYPPFRVSITTSDIEDRQSQIEVGDTSFKVGYKRAMFSGMTLITFKV